MNRETYGESLRTLIGNTFFFIDTDFKEVTYSMNREEYNQFQEGFSQLKEQIEETDK